VTDSNEMQAREEMQSAARLEAALSGLGADRTPPAGWEARVLAAIAEPPRRRWWWWLAIPSTALAAAVVLALVVWPRSRPLALGYEIEPTGPVVRGGSGAHIGDVLRATATGGGAHRALWIYRNEQHLVAVCPGASSCDGSATETIAKVTLVTPGDYKIVALTSSSPIPAPTGRFDGDLSRALDAGAEQKIESLDVR
jgi:hypothetical protein